MTRLRIAITQRCDPVPGRDEVRDALDWRLASLLWDLGFMPLPLVSGLDVPPAYLAELAPDGLLLSGGNDIGSAPARDALEQFALDYAVTQELPVLGICRGMQFMNHYQDGTLRPVTGHTAVKHRVLGPLVGDDGRMVNSYHDQGLTKPDLGVDLEAIAWSEDGVIEGLRHLQRPWLGIMWHPERDKHPSEADRSIIFKHFTEHQ